MKPAEKEPAVVVQRTYDLLLWLLPKVEKFPRSFRFSVGDRLVLVGLNLLQSAALQGIETRRRELLCYY